MSQFFLACWITLCQLAPWLLLGMLLAGLLHAFLPRGFVRREFHGFSGIVKAVLLGVPLPLCSCGVIPAGIGLKNQGASDGASVGFLISTPQTGVDSVLVSASFFGWPFALFKVVAAAVTGVIGGWLTDATEPVAASDVGKSLPVNQGHGHESAVGGGLKWKSALGHAIEVLRSIWVWLVIGILVSAAIESLGLNQTLSEVAGFGLLPAMILVLIVSGPLYVCATASVPIAAALVQSGLPPAVALVFLMAGPATNITTMGAIRSRFGFRVLAIYLATLIIGSFLFAYMFDWLLTSTVLSGHAHAHDHRTWWSVGSAIIVLGLIGWFIANDARRIWRRRAAIESESREFSVDGMHCGNCVGRLETGIGNLDGVTSVRADLQKKQVSVTGTAPASAITNVIETMGFQVLAPTASGATTDHV